MTSTQPRTAPPRRPGADPAPAPVLYRPQRDDWVVDTETGFVGRFQAVTADRAYIRPYGGGLEHDTLPTSLREATPEERDIAVQAAEARRGGDQDSR